MESSVNITEAEILDALRAALEEVAKGPDDALTTGDLVEATGWGEDRVRRMLRRMLRDGDAECVRVRRMAMDTRMAVVPAYRLKAKLA